ncbi:MAG: 50S ribosomal protein L23 [Candidatus Magasanikbacteria bacterium]|nr:50S ribosomal protein L23 [Candidatus Magasanikbacteria bacterium]
MSFLNKWTKKLKKRQLEEVEDGSKKEVEKKVASKKKEHTKTKSSKPTDQKKSKKTAKKKTVKKSKKGNAYKILIRPVISEKAAGLESKGVYTFVVHRTANKFDIKRAIEQIYGITPKKVRVMNMEGKTVRFGRYSGKRSDWKKAIITLAEGQSINIHEGV